MPTFTALTTLADAQNARALGDAMERLDPEPTGVGVFETEDGSGLWEVGGYFTESPDEGGLALLSAAFDARPFVISELPETDWVAKVRRELAPVEAGRFFLYGSHDADKVPDEAALDVVAEVVEEGGGAVFKLLEPHDASFLRGDTNDDGVVNLSDPVRILSVLFQGSEALYCEDAADANDDGTINLTDPILMLRTLFDGTAGISAPYPYRGFDPTPDELHCKDFEG